MAGRTPRSDSSGRIIRAILRWYAHQGRSLPWRTTRSAYRILVAEIMLHQTQVTRVLRTYPEFVKRFPTLRALAAASRTDVVIAWRGLGYNRRAVHLHETARTLSLSCGGRIPTDEFRLRSLPGIGRYTAAALLVSVHHRDLPVVDVNVRRVLSRIFWRLQTTIDTRPEREIWFLAASLVPSGRGYDWMQALMDLGATICTARAPHCPDCPVRGMCRSAGVLRPSNRPARREPSLEGVPDRLYRGRVVDLLRARAGHAWVSIDLVGKSILGEFRREQKSWLMRLIHRLERDGLVLVRRTGAPSCRTLIRLA